MQPPASRIALRWTRRSCTARSNVFHKLMLPLFLVTAVGCGGGGGGGEKAETPSAGFYAGNWDLQSVLVSNPCGAPIPSNFDFSSLVNQDGTRVVMDAGRLVLTGQTNKVDGFDVSGPGSSTQSCIGAVAVSFRDAGDGAADVGIAIGAECGGLRCVVGFSGTANRNGSRQVGLSKAIQLVPHFKKLEQAVLGLPAGAYGGAEDIVEDVEVAARGVR